MLEDQLVSMMQNWVPPIQPAKPVRTLESELEYMIEMWTNKVLPALVKSTSLRTKDHRIPVLVRDAQVLFMECDACEMSRNKYNEGRYDEGTFCQGSCPLAPGCGPVWFETVAHLEALQRAHDGKEEIRAPNCFKYCSAKEECDGTLQFCIDHLATNIAGVEEQWVSIANNIRNRLV